MNADAQARPRLNLRGSAAGRAVQRQRREHRLLLESAAALLHDGQAAECLSLAFILQARDPGCAGAHYLVGAALLEMEQPEAGLNNLRRARDLLSGGCRLPLAFRDDLMGVCEQGIEAVLAIRARAAPPELAAWDGELLSWASVLGRLAPDALLDLAGDARMADVRRPLVVLHGLARQGMLGMEAPR